MIETSSNNKRIAKNTLFLYLRMLLTMAVGLYTSRIVLKTLGVSDYGIYNVVGGVIAFLGYVNSLLAGGTSRFLTIALGKNDYSHLKITFSTTLVLTLVTASIIIFLGETIGLWFINNYLNIPADRMVALNWVYQCALISSALTVTQSPFTASIISHEKMDIYAYMSIFDAVMKLIIVYLLVFFEYDKLILYAILMLAVNCLNIFIYRLYCLRKFEECKLSFKFDKVIFKEMFTYSGWNMLGSLSWLLMTQGINIILNIFFGTVINAARGVANHVTSVAQNLFSNFQLAAKPQIFKYYAAGERQSMFKLMTNTSKYCGYLSLCVVIPLLVNIDGLLKIWLVEVPVYSSAFIRLTLVYTLIRSVNEALSSGIHAVGKMKIPNLTVGIINTLIFPATWLACKLGGGPITPNVIFLIDAPIVFTIDLLMVRHFLEFPVGYYLRNAVLPVFSYAILALILPVFIIYFLPEGTWYCLLSSALSVFTTAGIIFIFALPKHVKQSVIEKTKGIVFKVKKDKK